MWKWFMIAILAVALVILAALLLSNEQDSVSRGRITPHFEAEIMRLTHDTYKIVVKPTARNDGVTLLQPATGVAPVLLHNGEVIPWDDVAQPRDPMGATDEPDPDGKLRRVERTWRINTNKLDPGDYVVSAKVVVVEEGENAL